VAVIPVAQIRQHVEQQQQQLAAESRQAALSLAQSQATATGPAAAATGAGTAAAAASASPAHPPPSGEEKKHRQASNTEVRAGPAALGSRLTHLEAWLWKEDPTTGQWRRRYFILDKARLWYWELKFKGSIPIYGGLGVHAQPHQEATLDPQEANFGGFVSQTNFAFRFTLNTNDRVYHVASDTEADLQYWMDGLQQALKQESPPQTEEEARMQEELEEIADAFNQKAPEGEVTFVFTDVQNSTKLWEACPTGMNEGLEKHDALLRELLKRFRGYEVKTEGDAFMVTFFNAIDAVLWCIAVQRQLLQIDWPQNLLQQPGACVEYAKGDAEKKTPCFAGIRIRMGINTGRPNCRRNPITGRMDYFGPVVNRAARVSDSSHGGQIICTAEVHEALQAALKEGRFPEAVDVAELGSFNYKGIPQPVQVFQITPAELAGRLPFPPLRVNGKK
jgi:class 3 adenylate cyclase